MSWELVLKEIRLIKLRKLLYDSMGDKKFVDSYMETFGLTEKNADLEENIDEYINDEIQNMKTMAEWNPDNETIQFTTNYIKKLKELKR